MAGTSPEPHARLSSARPREREREREQRKGRRERGIFYFVRGSNCQPVFRGGKIKYKGCVHRCTVRCIRTARDDDGAARPRRWDLSVSLRSVADLAYVGPLKPRKINQRKKVRAEFNWKSISFPYCNHCNQRKTRDVIMHNAGQGNVRNLKEM